tara:strand:+ start:185 stop:307 length:123 start_codon:yes stop_codon:yes gene_type:complete
VDKQHKKLNKLQVKAELCIDRTTAQKIISKAKKTQDKLIS